MPGKRAKDRQERNKGRQSLYSIRDWKTESPTDSRNNHQGVAPCTKQVLQKPNRKAPLEEACPREFIHASNPSPPDCGVFSDQAPEVSLQNASLKSQASPNKELSDSGKGSLLPHEIPDSPGFPPHKKEAEEGSCLGPPGPGDKEMRILLKETLLKQGLADALTFGGEKTISGGRESPRDRNNSFAFCMNEIANRQITKKGSGEVPPSDAAKDAHLYLPKYQSGKICSNLLKEALAEVEKADLLPEDNNPNPNFFSAEEDFLEDLQFNKKPQSRHKYSLDGEANDRSSMPSFYKLRHFGGSKSFYANREAQICSISEPKAKNQSHSRMIVESSDQPNPFDMLPELPSSVLEEDTSESRPNIQTKEVGFPKRKVRLNSSPELEAELSKCRLSKREFSSCVQAALKKKPSTPDPTFSRTFRRALSKEPSQSQTDEKEGFGLDFSETFDGEDRSPLEDNSEATPATKKLDRRQSKVQFRKKASSLESPNKPKSGFPQHKQAVLLMIFASAVLIKELIYLR